MKRPSSLARALTIVFAVAGAAVRLEQFATRRSLWVDEAMLALNVVERGYGGLTRPLHYNQGAPIAWLWSERLVVQVFGVNEYALRAIPLLAGLATVVLVALVANRVAGPWAGAAACGLVAFAPALVRYSTEVKQYSSDAAVACILLLVALDLARQPSPTVAALATWAGVGAVAVWFSHPSVFVLAGVTAVLVGRALIHRRAADLPPLLFATLVWGGSFAAVYAVALRGLGRNEFLANYWQAGMAPRHAGAPDAIRWAGRVMAAAAADPGHWRPGVLGALAVLGGIAVAGVALRRATEAALLASVLIVAFGAAATRHYPFEGRLALYAVPVAAVSLGAIVEWAVVARARTSVVALAGGAVVLALAARPLWDVGAVARTPLTIGEIRPVLQEIRDHKRPGDEVWVHGLSQAPIRFYADLTGVAPTAALADGLPGTTCETGGRAIGQPSGRAWVVFAYRASGAPADEQQLIINTLRAHGHLVSEYRHPGAAGYLLDCGLPPDAPAGAAPSPLPCLQLQPVEAPPVTDLTTGPFGTGQRVRPPLLTD